MGIIGRALSTLENVASHWREHYTLEPVEADARLITDEKKHFSDLQLEAMTIARAQANIRDREQAAEAMRKGEKYELGHEPVRLHDYYIAAKDIIARENEHSLEENGTEPFNMGNMLRFHGTKESALELRDIEFNKHDFSAGEWDEVERGLSFNHAELINVTFIPATTLEALHLDRSSSVKIENAIFEEMGGEDRLTLPRGNYDTIAFSKVTGGTLELADGAVVNNLHSEGARMNIEMGRSVINGFTSDASTAILSFKAAPGAEFCDAHISEASFALDSDLRGTVWRNVKLNNVSIGHINFTGAQFNMVTIDDVPLTPADGFAKLIQMGVEADQLPNINGQSYEQYKQLTKQQAQEQNRAPRIEDYKEGDPRRTALELAAKLNEAVNGKNGEETKLTEVAQAQVPQTEQAKERIEERNEAFAESMAAIRMSEARSDSGDA